MLFADATVWNVALHQPPSAGHIIMTVTLSVTTLTYVTRHLVDVDLAAKFYIFVCGGSNLSLNACSCYEVHFHIRTADEMEPHSLGQSTQLTSFKVSGFPEHTKAKGGDAITSPTYVEHVLLLVSKSHNRPDRVHA